MKLFERVKNKKSKVPYFVSLDIGTEFVKALIFKIEDGRGVIVGTGRARQRLGDMHGGTVTDIAGVVENCSKALDLAEEMSGVVADQCIIGIAGELVKGTTTTVHYERLNLQLHNGLQRKSNLLYSFHFHIQVIFHSCMHI